MCNVNIVTGEVTQFVTDFFLPGIIPLHFIRSYSSTSTEMGPLGYGWKHNFEVSLHLSDSQATLAYDNGKTATLPLRPINVVPPAPLSGLTLTRTSSEIVITEPDQNRLVFVRPERFGQLWLLVRKEDPYGNAIRFTYDTHHRIVGITDTEGRLLTFHYNRQGRLQEIRLAENRGLSNFVSMMTYEHNHVNDLIATTDRSQASCTYAYQDHLLTSVTNRIGGHLYYQYDRDRRCVRTWRDGGVQYREIRHHHARMITAVIDSHGYTTLYRNNEKGLTEEEVDLLGRTKRDVYDGDGNLLLNNSAAGGLQEVLIHDKVNKVVRLISNIGEIRFEVNDMGQPLSFTNAEGQTSLYEYDHGGNLTRSVSPLGAEWRFFYDQFGRLVRTVDPIGYEVRHERTSNPPTTADVDALGVLSKRSFDIYGNLIALENESGHRTEIQYDPAGNPVKVIYPDGSTGTYTYDAESNMLSDTDGTGLTTRYEYDLNDSLIAVIDPAGQRTTLMYDTEENLVSITNTRGERSELVYDALGRETKTTYFDGRIECYEYDDRDRLIRIRTGQGRLIVDLSYDDANRLVSKKWADGKEVTISYGTQNQILSLTGTDQDLFYEWDADLRMVKQQLGDVTLELEYDSADNRVGLKTSKGRHIHYEWDLRKRLTRIVDSGQYAYEYSYNPSGCITEARFPDGLRQRFDYDLLDRMIVRSVLRPDGTELTRRQFRYDGQSRLYAMQDLQRGSFEYHYDSQDHIGDVIKDGQLVEHYDYDGEDNLLLTRGGTAVVLERGNQVVRAGGVEYHYDDFGNLVLRKQGAEETRYEYNLDGDLVKVRDSRGNTFEFRYDPLGRRVAKLHNGKRQDFLWDGVALLEETEDGQGTTEYLFMPESFFPVGQTQGGEHYTYSFDQLGTPTELFDSHGNIAWAVEYTAFGELRNTFQAQTSSPFRFLGQYCDDELGLFYTHYRYYDPQLGRFTSPDPIRFTGGPNFYRYVINPVNWVDPFGLASGTCVLRKKCSWNKKQQKDFEKKARQ